VHLWREKISITQRKLNRLLRCGDADGEINTFSRTKVENKKLFLTMYEKEHTNIVRVCVRVVHLYIV